MLNTNNNTPITFNIKNSTNEKYNRSNFNVNTQMNIIFTIDTSPLHNKLNSV